MFGTILAFCFFGFCAGGGHWHHPHHHHREHPGLSGHREDATNELVPSDWRSQPGDAHERRFVSPNGEAELRASWTATSQESVASHMRNVAFERGEKLAYIQGGSDWIAVAGIKDDRQFYRQAVLACEGRRWHQIEIDYPPADTREMAKLVARSSRALTDTRNAGCDDPDAPAGAAVPMARDGGAAPAETTGEGSAPANAGPPRASGSRASPTTGQ
jgi:hypothetical protein